MMSLNDADRLFPGGLPDDPQGRAAAVRAAADGELDPEQLELLCKDGSIDRAISFERGLRDAVARVMDDGVSAPADLRGRVLAASVRAEGGAEGDESAGRLEQLADQTRERSFWSGQRRLVGAIAAVLVLTVAGVFVARLARINQSPDVLAYRTDLAMFVSAEHARTLDDNVAQSKYVYTTVEKAVDKLGSKLRRTPSVLPCDETISFRGAAPCGVPGKGPSCHFQYTITREDGSRRTVSLFVKEYNGELGIEEGTTYRIKTGECNLPGVHICVWRQDGLLYMLVSDQCNAGLCGSLLDNLGIARPGPGHEI